MNFIDQLADKLSILRGDIDGSEVAYINAPVEDLSGFAKTVMKGNGLAGDIQEADRFHITLAIFPNFPESAIGDFLQLSLPIRFNVTATKLGTFPKAPSKPLIMHVDPDPALVRLQADIYNLGLKLGLQLPDYDHFKASLWQPHITLAMDVKGMPDEFAPINPVKVGVDRFVVQREGYDQVVEINLPGTLEDRPFITVRSVVPRAVQVEEIIERIAPKTLEVSRKEFMAMLRGDVVVHGPTRRVLTFDDGPFAIRHGKHVGQEGRKGEKGGTEPGFKHEEVAGDSEELFHGTSEKAAKSIMEFGLQVSFSDDNNTEDDVIYAAEDRRDAMHFASRSSGKQYALITINASLTGSKPRTGLFGELMFGQDIPAEAIVKMEIFSRGYQKKDDKLVQTINRSDEKSEELFVAVGFDDSGSYSIMGTQQKQDDVEEEELPLIADTPQGRKAAGKKVPIGTDESVVEEEEEVVERGRPVVPKPKTVYTKKEKEYPDYFEGQEKVGAAAYGTQVFTPFLLGHVENFEGSRQSSASESYHRVVGAQKEKNKDVHGFALSNNGNFVGIGALDYAREENPSDGDFIHVESLTTSEPGNSQAAIEKLINQASSEDRGITMHAGDGAKEFLSSIGMRDDGKGLFYFTPEDIQAMSVELKGPKPGGYIAPSSKPKVRQRFGNLFEETEVTTPIDNQLPPASRDSLSSQARDKWDRFNWDAFQDPEMVWNPEMQMAGVFEENKNALFEDEIDEVAERGKSDILSKINEGGKDSVAFGRLEHSVADLFGGHPRHLEKYMQSGKDLERDYGLEVVWPNGKIEDDEELANEHLLNFAQQAEGVRDEDSMGNWPDSAEYIYNRTQDAFKVSGFETGDKVRLYRGMAGGNMPEEHDGGWVKLNMGALSSWTFNRSTAAHAATREDKGTLLRIDIPVSRLFSMWATGPGSREAMEYLILGQDGIRAWATKISRK